MKKILPIICLCVVVVIAITISCVIIFTNTDSKIEVVSVKLQGFTKDISLGTIKVTSYSDNGRNGFSFVPKDDSDVEAIVMENEYYVSEKIMNIEGLEKTGWLFYKDNNVYLLYKSAGDEYTFINVYSEYQVNDNETLAFPSIARINITPISFELAEQGNYDLLGFIFNIYDYSSAKEIYTLFDGSYVSFNDSTQQISIKGFNVQDNTESTYPCIIIDFLNEKVGYIDADGLITYME